LILLRLLVFPNMQGRIRWYIFFMFLSFEIVLLWKFYVFIKLTLFLCHWMFVIRCTSRVGVTVYMIQILNLLLWLKSHNMFLVFVSCQLIHAFKVCLNHNFLLFWVGLYLCRVCDMDFMIFWDWSWNSNPTCKVLPLFIYLIVSCLEVLALIVFDL
jgi:hypothetical protein